MYTKKIKGKVSLCEPHPENFDKSIHRGSPKKCLFYQQLFSKMIAFVRKPRKNKTGG